jgi:4-amino-4-deoxy-L-arabinose transferase-like glycosyltransferase
MNGNNALEAISTNPPTGGYKVFYPENNGREGLFINIQAQFLKLFLSLNENQPEPWMLRFPSALFGTLTVLGIFFLGKELFSVQAGILSSFFLATSFWHVMFSRIGFRAIMAPLLLVWGAYFFLKAIRTASTNTNRVYLYAVSAGVIYGLGFYTYIAYRITPILFLLFIPFFRHEKNFWQLTAVFLGATILVALPIGLYYLANPADFLGRTSQVSVFSSPTPIKDLSLNIVKTLGMFNFQSDFNWRHNDAGKPQLFWLVGIFFIVGIVKMIQRIIKSPREEKFPSLFLFSGAILTAMPVVISNEGIPHALRAILMIPSVFLFAGIGASEIYDRLRKNFWSTTILPASIALLLVAEAYGSYFVRWGGSPHVPGAFSADYVQLGYELNALPRDIPKYVVVRGGGVLVNEIPMPSQTVMYITDTYTKEKQAAKNIFYVTPENEDSIPAGALKIDLY